jgi:ubiquitin thioesterase protein OTUB1
LKVHPHLPHKYWSECGFGLSLQIFVEQLQSVIQGRETSISLETLIERCRDQYVSNYVVMFFRFVTSGEIRRRTDFFEPFILGMSGMNVVQFCRSAVEPMGEESDHVHITALSDALGVPVRVVYLDRSGDTDDKPAEVNHHDFIPVGSPQTTVDPFVVLLYRPGHYDILYTKQE